VLSLSPAPSVGCLYGGAEIAAVPSQSASLDAAKRAGAVCLALKSLHRAIRRRPRDSSPSPTGRPHSPPSDSIPRDLNRRLLSLLSEIPGPGMSPPYSPGKPVTPCRGTSSGRSDGWPAPQTRVLPRPSNLCPHPLTLHLITMMTKKSVAPGIEDELEHLRAMLAGASQSPPAGGVRGLLHRLAERLATPQRRLILRRIHDAEPLKAEPLKAEPPKAEPLKKDAA
jgi:hypothetical protein